MHEEEGSKLLPVFMAESITEISISPTTNFCTSGAGGSTATFEHIQKEIT